MVGNNNIKMHMSVDIEGRVVDPAKSTKNKSSFPALSPIHVGKSALPF